MNLQSRPQQPWWRHRHPHGNMPAEQVVGGLVGKSLAAAVCFKRSAQKAWEGPWRRAWARLGLAGPWLAPSGPVAGPPSGQKQLTATWPTSGVSSLVFSCAISKRGHPRRGNRAGRGQRGGTVRLKPQGASCHVCPLSRRNGCPSQMTPIWRKVTNPTAGHISHAGGHLPKQGKTCSEHHLRKRDSPPGHAHATWPFLVDLQARLPLALNAGTKLLTVQYQFYLPTSHS